MTSILGINEDFPSCVTLLKRPGCIPTAAVERAHSDRARSGSTGIGLATLFSYFSSNKPLKSMRSPPGGACLIVELDLTASKQVVYYLA
jgi:hypothetical protein